MKSASYLLPVLVWAACIAAILGTGSRAVHIAAVLLGPPLFFAAAGYAYIIGRREREP